MSVLHKRRRLALLGLAAVTALAGACDDPFALEANLETVRDTLVAFAMTGTSAAFPSAYDATTGAAVRIGPDVAFDVALDINSDGTIKVVPARLVSQTKVVFGTIGVTHQVALQTPAGGFEAITIAPTSGYKIDSVLTVSTGETVVMRVESDNCFLSPVMYAKLVVDSVNTTTRELFIRSVRNPNCGFRSFQPGVPKE